jgi:hypothetical protein
VPANTATPTSAASTWSFDAAGRFVVSVPGSNACDGTPMYGTYELGSRFFEITSNWNLGLCDWWFTAAYPHVFDADCSHLTLTEDFDNCTGGRGYLNGTTTLTRLR